MSVEMLKQIRDAEEAAAQIIRNAEQEARRLSDELLKTALSRTQTQKEKYYKEADEIIVNAMKKAEAEAEKITAENKRQCDNLVTATAPKIEKAAQFIVKGMIEAV